MADGVIRIKIDVDGKELELTNKDLDQVENKSNKAGAGIKKFATSLGLVAIGAVAFTTLKNSMDDAINRFDTLNKFPKVLQALGVSAEDSKKAMSRLSEGIDGLPTKLNDIAQTAQRMYTSFGDMDKATDSAIALNNALLGSGSSAEQAKRGTEMYLKALQTGKIDMNTWNTLSETMDVGLVKIAESFGFVGKSAKDDLYKALQDGTITLDQFNDALIEVGTGTGIMAKLARENTLGIATSFENLKTAAVRGLVEIIDAFNNLSKRVTGREIAQNIDSLKVIVFSSFQAMAKVIEATTPVVVLFANGVKMAIPVVKALSPAIIGLMTAYGAYVVITKASTAIQASNAIMKVAQASKTGLTLVTKAHTTALATELGMTNAQTAATIAQTGAVKLSTLAIGVMTGTISVSTAVKTIATAAAYALGAAIRFMLGPIGWVVTGIGLLTTGIIALVKWFNRATEEGKRLASETESLSESTDSLVDSVTESDKAYREQQQELDITSRKYSDLSEKVFELAEKEKLSANEKERMNSYIQQLNESMDGLNLAYDEEADALNMTSEEIAKRIELMRDLDGVLSVQDRLNELTEEQIAIEMQLEETRDLREEWNEALKESSVTGKEYTEAVEELNSKEIELKETLGEVSEQHAETEEQVKQTMSAITQAIEDGTASQMISLDMFSEKQRETIESMNEKWREYEEMTTDMFDRLSDEIKITASEMADNLEENQRIVSEWADNIAILAERGVDDGLLDKLREAGPESAGHVNALVNASDDELARLNDVFSEGGEVATDALAKSLGIENTDIMDAVGHLVSDTESTLRDEIANAGFDDIGIDVAKGLAEGTKKGTPEAESAAKDMADDTTKATKDAFGVQSPSTVFKAIGEDLTSGLALGINGGTSKVITAIQSMFKSVEASSNSSFQTLTSGYRSSVSQMSNEMAKLPVAVAREMTLVNNILNASSVAQINSMQQLARGYNQGGVAIALELTLMNKIVDTSMTAMLNHINKNIPLILGSLRALAGSIPIPFNSLPSEMQKIGADAMNGFNRGLKSRKSAVMATARDIANSAARTMRQALDTHSPSRVFMAIGEDTVKGYEVGIKKRQRHADKEVTDLFKRIMSTTDKAFKSQLAEINKNNAEIKKVETRASEDIYLIEKKAKEDKRKLTEAESIRIRRIEEDSTKKIQNLQSKNNKIEKDIAEKQSKELLQIAEKYVEDKRKNGEMSLQDEIYFWNAMYRNAEKGSEQYELGLKNHQEAVKSLRGQVESINKEYNDKILAINKEFNDESQRLHDEWEKAYDDHFSKLLNFAGIFDEFKRENEITGQDLIKNLESQVVALDDYGKVMESLGKRIDDADLLKELEGMGVKAVGELQALNSLSDEELSKYVELYRKKFMSAKFQTDEAMEEMTEDTDKKLVQLKKDTSRRLDELDIEWQKKIKGIVETADEEFDSLRQVGIDAMQGLSDGMSSMEGALVSQARSIADSIRHTIASAFDIHSPSRWMRDFIGKNMMLGWIKGIDGERTAVLRKAFEMAEWMKPDALVENRLRGASLPINNLIPSNAVSSIVNNTSSRRVSNDNRNINITVDAGNLNEVQQVIELFTGLKQTARSY